MLTSSIIDLVEPYYGIGVCNENTLSILQKMTFSMYDELTNFLVDQISIKTYCPTYTIYKVDIMSKLCSHHLDIDTNIGDMFHTTIQATDKFIMLHTLSQNTLILFLSEHQSRLKRYLFLPVVFGHEIHQTGHCASLVFDMIEHKVYFVDPNGTTRYFDHLLIDLFAHFNKGIKDVFIDEMAIDTEELVEILFKMYIVDLNLKFDTKFEFVPRKIWNMSEYEVNRSPSNSVIGDGHCVATTILINHILHASQENISDVIKALGTIPVEANVELINNYSIGLTDLVKQFK